MFAAKRSSKSLIWTLLLYLDQILILVYLVLFSLYQTVVYVSLDQPLVICHLSFREEHETRPKKWRDCARWKTCTIYGCFFISVEAN